MDRLTKARIYAWRARRLSRRVASGVVSTSRSDPAGFGEAEFEGILSAFDADSVFVHVGLSDVKSAFGGDPYAFLLEKLTDAFESVMAPGFTPSFRRSGVYHKRFSRPEYGTFSKLFLDDAEYRTDDAIHSILVHGDYRFEDCDHHDSFGPSGCWDKFDRDDVLYLNVGTDGFLATQLHYVEVRNDLPYTIVSEHEGVVYVDDAEYEEITQRNYDYDYDFWLNTYPNWPKIKSYLESRDVLADHSRNGLRIHSVRARAMREALEEQLARDPYYLVT